MHTDVFGLVIPGVERGGGRPIKMAPQLVGENAALDHMMHMT